jgi:hypothetical protein
MGFEEPHEFLSSPNIVRVMKSSRMNGRGMEHVRGRRDRLTGFCRRNLKERDYLESLGG